MQSPTTPEKELDELKAQWGNFVDDTLVMLDEAGPSDASSSKSIGPMEETNDDDIQIIAEVKNTTKEVTKRKRPLNEAAKMNGKTKKQKFVETYQEHYKRDEKRIKLNGSSSELLGDICQNELVHTSEDYFIDNSTIRTSYMPTLNNEIWTRINVYKERYPKKFDHFDKQIMRHYERNIQNDATFSWKMEVRRKILSVINEFDRTAGLFVVGSTINGCGSLNADMDMCCAIRVPTYGNNDRSFALKALRKIKNQLFKNKTFLEMSNCYLITAKVPILRLTFSGNYKSLEVDLNVNNLAGVYNSFLLHYYSRVDDRFPALCLLVKHWAKRNKIGDAMNGFLNSYSIILLVIHFLQVAITPAILPNLQELYPEMFNENRPIHECALFQVLPQRYPDPSLNKNTLGELLIAFFEYYSTFDFENWAISICRACVFPRNELPASTRRFKMFIEEPFDKNNTARCVTTDLNYGIIMNTFGAAKKWFLGKRRPDIKHIGVQDIFNLES